MTQTTQNDMRRVLIVDDDEAVVTSMAHILKSKGLCAITATDWVDAVEVISHDPPDAILLDMHMPRVDGAAFLRFIRDEGSHVPVIVVSAFVNDALKRSLIGLKVSAFVAKPFGIDELLDEVERVLPLPLVPAEETRSDGVKAETASEPKKKRARIKKRRRRYLKKGEAESHAIVYVGVGVVCVVLTALLGILY